MVVALLPSEGRGKKDFVNAIKNYKKLIL